MAQGNVVIGLDGLESAHDVHTLVMVVDDLVAREVDDPVVLDLAGRPLSTDAVEALTTVLSDARQLGIRIELQHVDAATMADLNPPLDA